MREDAVANRAEIVRLEHANSEMDEKMLTQVTMAKQKMTYEQDEKDAEGKAKQTYDEEQLRVSAAMVFDVQRECTMAKESSRLFAARLEDTKRELRAVEFRYAQAVKELEARRRVSGSDEEAAAETVQDVWERLAQAEEERNVLRNELECQQVQSQAELEDEKRQHATNVARLEEALLVAVKEQKRLDEALKESQRQLAMRPLQPPPPTVAAAPQLPPPTGWSLFRCPGRARPAGGDGGRQPFVGGSLAAGGSPSSQSMIWQITSAISGITALFCNAETLQILDASKKAFMMWGSSALRSSTLVAHIFNQDAGAWLQTEISGSRQSFWLREFGYMEFRSKLGSPFDSSVKCARLPEEPQQGLEAAVLVIVEPLEEETNQKPGPPQRIPGQRGVGSRVSSRCGALSVASSVRSEDITANDSVSNVNAT